MDLRHLLLHPRPDRASSGSARNGRARPTGRSSGSSSSSGSRPSAIARRSPRSRSAAAKRPNRSRASCPACRARCRPTRSSARSWTSWPTATGADHIVVARRRPDARVLEATLVSARPGVPDSTTRLPIADLEDPVDGRGPGEREPVAIPIDGGDAGSRSRPARLRGRFDDVTARLGGRRAGQRRPRRPTRDAADPGVAPGDRRPDRDADPPGLRPDQHAGRAADRGRRGRSARSSCRTARPATGRRRPAGCCPARRRRRRRRMSRAYSHRAAETQASTDALTGLPNRRYFDEFCGLLARRRRSGDAVGVLMIDIDKFKVAQRHARPRDRRRGPARGRWRDRRRPSARTTSRPATAARSSSSCCATRARTSRSRSGSASGRRSRRSTCSRLGVAGVSVSVGVAVAGQADQPIGDLIAAGRPGAVPGQARRAATGSSPPDAATDRGR